MAARLSEGTVIRDPDTGSPVHLAAGMAVPEWASGLVGEHLLEADDESGDGDQGGYGSMTVSELKAEIAARNEGRDEADLVPDEGKKADLVAALEADDEG